MPIATGPAHPGGQSQLEAPVKPAAGHSGMPGSSYVPWELWCGALAVFCSTFGLEWDLSWHYSIGRDTFWTPAHMVIYMCGVLSALACGYLIVATTFGHSADRRAHAVSVLGLRAPLGAFLASWGGLAMLVSAPFDNWWHSAYGLDVHVITPPHTLLLMGVDLIALGFLLLIAGAMNRAAAAGSPNFDALRRVFLLMGGLIVLGHMLGITQLVERPWLHSTGAYKALAVAVASLFALLWQASRHRWAATSAALVYTIIRVIDIQVFPLFPATPKLGPVLTPLTHFVPQQFPILILLPAIALDLLWRRMGTRPLWLNAIASGLVFSAVLDPAEWFFADFLNSKVATNRFFGTIYFPFGTSPIDRLPHFARAQSGWPLATGMLEATLLAILASWFGLLVGRWIRSVQR